MHKCINSSYRANFYYKYYYLPRCIFSQESLEKRTEWLKRYCNAITDTFFYEVDVAFATHERNKSLNTQLVSNKHLSEQSKLESLE